MFRLNRRVPRERNITRLLPDLLHALPPLQRLASVERRLLPAPLEPLRSLHACTHGP